MIKTKIAVISDIHGNSIALNEVINDIKIQGIETIINLGDSLYGPLDPKGTFDILTSNKVLSISGNQDRFILENMNVKSDMITLEYVKSQIDNNMLDWLQYLSFDKVVSDEIYCCHASPESDSTYLLESLQTDHVAVKTSSELDDKLKEINYKIIVCGHSHVSGIATTFDKTIINPGSVGLPAYDDDLPLYHKMENYSPNAKYSILQLSDKPLKVDQISLSYDFEKAASLAEKNKRNDWAKWIRTGRV